MTKKPEGNEDNLAYVGLNFTLERNSISTGVWWSAAETITYPFLREIDRIASNNSGTSSLIIYTFNDKMFPPGLLSLISGKGYVYKTFYKYIVIFLFGNIFIILVLFTLQNHWIVHYICDCGKRIRERLLYGYYRSYNVRGYALC